MSALDFDTWSKAKRGELQGVNKTQARKPRNTEKLFAVVLSAAKRTDTAKYNLIVQLGALVHDPKAVVGDNGRRARVFTVDQAAKSMKEKFRGSKDDLLKEYRLYAYDVFDFGVDEKDYLAYAGETGVDAGDVVELYGISFSYWVKEVDSEPRLFHNVDRVSLVAGAQRGGYAHDIWLALERPLERIRLEEGKVYDDAKYNQQLGKAWYALNAFGTDAAGGKRYLATPGEHELVQFGFVPEKDPANPKIDTMSYVPSYFDTKLNADVFERGFTSVGLVDQYFAAASDHQDVKVFVKTKEAQLAPFGMTNRELWGAVAPVLMPQVSFTLLARENLEKTLNENLGAKAGADEDDNGDDNEVAPQFTLVASVQGLLVNMAAQLERVGFAIPPDRVLEFLGSPADGKLKSPDAATAYHARADRGDLVIALHEAELDVAELVRRGRYQIVLVSNIGFDDESLETLQDEDPTKRYLIFDRVFRTAYKNAAGAKAKADVARAYGLDEASNLPSLGVLAASAKPLFYAVLKAEHRARDIIDRPAFREALDSLVPQPDVFLAHLRGAAVKRPAEDAPVDAPNGKAARGHDGDE